ncbi:MAG: hypothetical protein IH907_06770 [Proteobacteria bacterium]|nr:hypothetical protein [Pseudomonadota bacterium]
MPDLKTLDDALESAGASCGAAEAHGMLCAEAQRFGTRWLAENVSEVMADLAQFAQAVNDGSDAEEEEAAFTAVLEYLRPSVLFICEELAGLRGRTGEWPLTH